MSQFEFRLPTPTGPSLKFPIAPVNEATSALQTRRPRAPRFPKRHFGRLAHALILERQPKIPVEPRTLSTAMAADRGFLPWRLSDAGRVPSRPASHQPASETLHISGPCLRAGERTFAACLRERS